MVDWLVVDGGGGTLKHEKQFPIDAACVQYQQQLSLASVIQSWIDSLDQKLQTIIQINKHAFIYCYIDELFAIDVLHTWNNSFEKNKIEMDLKANGFGNYVGCRIPIVPFAICTMYYLYQSRIQTKIHKTVIIALKQTEQLISYGINVTK